MIPINYDIIIFKEDESFVSYCPELDVSSCGDTVEHAKEMLKTAVRLFIEEAGEMGTLENILTEANFTKDANGRWMPPELVSVEYISI